MILAAIASRKPSAMTSFLDQFTGGYRPGRLGKNTIFATTGLGTRAVIQAGYLIVLSRWMGASGYGLFAGSVAIAILVAPLANWGSSLLLTQYVARNRNRSRGMWASALTQTGIIGGVLVVLLLIISAIALKERVDLSSMLLLGLSELILLPAAQAATSQCFALERGFASALAICLVPIGRLLAVLAFVVMAAAGTPSHAAVAHFAGSVAGLVAAFALVASVDGLPAWRSRLRIRDAVRQGAAYAVGGLVGTSYLEIDKVLMLQLLGAAIVGPYTAAFRVISVFALPVSALISVTLPRMFATHGNPGNLRTIKVVTVVAVAYAVIASVIPLFIAPWVPDVFGVGYAETTRYVLLLSPWPILYALHQCAAAALTASGRQNRRVVVEGLGLFLVAILNLLLLHRLGAEASVLALLVGEAFMVVGCWFWRVKGPVEAAVS